MWISVLLGQEGRRMRICWCCLSNLCGWPNIYRNMQCTFALCTCWEHIYQPCYRLDLGMWSSSSLTFLRLIERDISSIKLLI